MKKNVVIKVFVLLISLALLCKTSLADNIRGDNMQKAAFAAGCFWGVEEHFRTTKGVISTKVGYCGGDYPDPNYRVVCTGSTNHAETVEIEYDPKLISYNQLLDIFWEIHDPTTLNRQGPDYGTQYRSIIFYFNSEQEKLALASKEARQKKLREPIVTQILPISDFYDAEEYHQKYLLKHGLNVCH